VKAPSTSLSITPIEDADVTAIIALWQRCGLRRPWNDPAADIALARKVPNADVLAGRDAGRIVASVLVGHDGHRGWVYYLAVDPDRRHKGCGGAIMAAAEDWLRARHRKAAAHGTAGQQAGAGVLRLAGL
jgi:GNAT superfamily N-acetyltransferase